MSVTHSLTQWIGARLAHDVSKTLNKNVNGNENFLNE